MMGATRFFLTLKGDEGTARFGAMLASVLQPGDVITLEGDLGAGKTALARAIIRALSNDPDLEVPSPTFSLVQPYQAGSLLIFHADLYRLADESELSELGLEDDSEAIVLVEWAERAPGLEARANIGVTLEMADAGAARQLVLTLPEDRSGFDKAVRAAGLEIVPQPQPF